MKVIAASIIVFASQTNAKFLRQLQQCPTPGGGAMCPDVLLPVGCGNGYQCVYDNDCLANQAGFVNCLPLEPECPIPGAGMACPSVKKEVICNGECRYDNSCLANAAGYAPGACLEVPPPCNPTTSANCPPTTVPPPTNPPLPPPCNPTTGANCPPPTMVNTRTANTASIPSPLPEVCPTPGAGMICPMNIDRVACGEGFNCIYDNSCLANAAGFVNCLPMEEQCPLPGAGIICPMNSDPVRCNGSCIYANACLANAAGFASSSCVAVNQPDNIPQPCNPTTGANCPPPVTTAPPLPPCQPTTTGACDPNRNYLRRA